MKKKLLSSLLISALIISAASCSGGTTAKGDSSSAGGHSSYGVSGGVTGGGTSGGESTSGGSSTSGAGTSGGSSTSGGSVTSGAVTSGSIMSSSAGAADTGSGDGTAADTTYGEESFATTTAAATAAAVKDDIAGEALEPSFAADGEALSFEDSFKDASAECETPTTLDYNQARSGLLTGGEWRDNSCFNFWKSLLGQRDDWKELPETWKLNTTERIFVRATANGSPACGLTVKLMNDGSEVWRSITDSKGEAFLFAGMYYKKLAAADKIIVETSDGKTISQDISADDFGAPDPIIVETQSAAPMRTQLDLMLMVDTTGSMGDELRYLQKELSSVIDRVKNDSGADVQLSVNFYRDKNDDYVVRDFDFTSNISVAIEHLEDQRAAGGGDYPEAVTTALNNAIYEHKWRENSEKIMLLVLDAPPHDEDASELPGLLKSASYFGIRIIPVASSGVNTDTEFLCRSMAIATGGTYTFLTDDSGVGFSHLEPTIGDYTVEKLNDMLVRIINDYFSQEPRVYSNYTPPIPDPQPVDPYPVPGITLTGPVFPTPVYAGGYTATWFKTGDYYEDTAMNGTKVIWSKKGLERFFEDYGYKPELADFVSDVDFDSNAVAVDIKTYGTGSISVSKDFIYVSTKDGRPAISYKVDMPEVGTCDMATLFVAAVIPQSEITETLNDEQLAEMKKVDDALAEVAREAKKNSQTSWADKTKEKLTELAAQGLVRGDSIYYDGHFCSFEYKVNGVYATLSGAVMTDSATDDVS